MIPSPQEQGMDSAKQSRLIHTGRKENPRGPFDRIGLVPGSHDPELRYAHMCKISEQQIRESK